MPSTDTDTGVWTLEADPERPFPEGLRNLESRCPGQIFGVGSRDLVAGLEPAAAVTIVGARRASPYGLAIAHELAAGAGAAGLVVVSGLALGCDSAAHEGALEAGALTIAVLAAGPERASPPSRARLYRRILDCGGAVISEHRPSTHPEPWMFRTRDRLMAALAGVCVVVEGASRSGTRVTADEALELGGRELGAVPGSVHSGLSALPNELIRDGAALIRDRQDLLDLALGPGVVDVRRSGPALEPILRDALAVVAGDGGATCDGVAHQLDCDGPTAAVLLARLELLGYAEASFSGRFTPSGLLPPRDEDSDQPTDDPPGEVANTLDQ